MEFGLEGRKIALLAAEGVEPGSLTEPRWALEAVGAIVHLVSVAPGTLARPGASARDRLRVTATAGEARVDDYDALVIADGSESVRRLREDPATVAFVRHFMELDKPVAAIGDGVAVLASADALRGRTVTASRAVTDELHQAGASVESQVVHVDQRLLTARGGEDLVRVAQAIVREFSNRLDERKVDELSEQSFPASDPPPGPLAAGGGSTE